MSLFTVHSVGPDEERYALLPSDGDGVLLGEIGDVVALRDGLARVVAAGDHDGTLAPTDPRLPWLLLTVEKAAAEAKVAERTIRYASERGHIEDAYKKRVGRREEWRIPRTSLRSWMENRPKPGPKRKTQEPGAERGSSNGTSDSDSG